MQHYFNETETTNVPNKMQGNKGMSGKSSLSGQKVSDLVLRTGNRHDIKRILLNGKCPSHESTVSQSGRQKVCQWPVVHLKDKVNAK